MLDNTRIGNFISRQRRAKGLTGEKLAERLGVSPQAAAYDRITARAKALLCAE